MGGYALRRLSWQVSLLLSHVLCDNFLHTLSLFKPKGCKQVSSPCTRSRCRRRVVCFSQNGSGESSLSELPLLQQKQGGMSQGMRRRRRRLCEGVLCAAIPLHVWPAPVLGGVHPPTGRLGCAAWRGNALAGGRHMCATCWPVLTWLARHSCLCHTCFKVGSGTSWCPEVCYTSCRDRRLGAAHQVHTGLWSV